MGLKPQLQEPFMCDYSLHHVASRPAKVGDKLFTTEFAKSSARGFAAVGEFGVKLVIHDGPPKVAVCLLPGTELAFDDDVRYDRAFSLFGKARSNHKVARFRQIDLDDPHVHHDALEFPDGQVLKVTRLVAGQTATVLQLPVVTQHPEAVEIRHVSRSSDSRVALNRVPLRSGMASVLMPNQATVLLWQTLHSTAIGLSIALVQSLRRLKAHKQHLIPRAALPAGVDAEKIEASFTTGEPAVAKPTAQKPEKKIDVHAAA
jgi:hypothetical protein